MINPVQTEIEKLMTETPSVDRQIDRIGQTFQEAVQSFFRRRGERGQRLRDFLNGDWLGYPLHSAINDLPVGAWTSGIIFDYLGSITGVRAFERAGDYLTGLGVIGAVAASIAGLADYSELPGEERRFGTVHAILNGASLIAYLDSLAQRSAGNRSAAISLATLGFLGLLTSTDIGRTMVYRYGTMVDHQALMSGPREFTPVMSANELSDGDRRVCDVGRRKILLARVNGQVNAVDDICPQDGCSLGEGRLVIRSIVCPCCHSHFSLETGTVLKGPSRYPTTPFDIRVENGMIEVRQRAA